jgi:hypothetical protein
MVMTIARKMIGRKIETRPYLSRILMMRDIRGELAIPAKGSGCFLKVSMNLCRNLIGTDW